MVSFNELRPLYISKVFTSLRKIHFHLKSLKILHNLCSNRPLLSTQVHHYKCTASLHVNSNKDCWFLRLSRCVAAGQLSLTRDAFFTRMASSADTAGQWWKAMSNAFECKQQLFWWILGRDLTCTRHCFKISWYLWVWGCKLCFKIGQSSDYHLEIPLHQNSITEQQV